MSKHLYFRVLEFCLLILGLACPAIVKCQTVVRYSGAVSTLADRWAWAQREAKTRGFDDGYWVGYRIGRLMEEDSYISSGESSSGTINVKKPLYNVVEPRGTDSSISRRRSDGSSSHDPRRSIFKRMKDVAVLVRFGERQVLQDVRISNMELSFNLKSRPLLWLDSTEDEESVALLRLILKDATTERCRENLVNAVGIHQHSSSAYPFLIDILKSRETSRIRAQATFWIREQGGEQALGVLCRAAQDDPAREVREQATFAISQMESNESLDSLIALARRGRDSEVRSKATFWLGQKASERAISTLEEIAVEDDDTEVQRHALFALAQMPDGRGVEKLVEVAKTHPNKRIRKQAVMSLGQSNDPRAREALIDILKQ